MRKSQTGVFLPSIKSHRASLTGRTKMKSVFLERVKQEVKQETQYQSMDRSVLGEQQKKLKQLLREFNDRSQSILADYIASPVRSLEPSPPRQSMGEAKKVLQQEQIILSKVVQQCQNELRVLEVRGDNLKYTTREQMERQIRHIKTEIEQTRVSNKALHRSAKLNGLDICRGDGFDQVPDLQYQKLQTDARLSSLQIRQKDFQAEIESLKSRTTAVDKQISTSELQYNSAVSQQEGLQGKQKLKQVAKQRNKQIDYLKCKNEQAGVVCKMKYFAKLKELDEAKTLQKKNAGLIERREEDLGRSRKQLIVLEHKLSSLKQKATTYQLLVNK